MADAGTWPPAWEGLWRYLQGIGVGDIADTELGCSDYLGVKILNWYNWET